jgi:hypothetical protein
MHGRKQNDQKLALPHFCVESKMSYETLRLAKKTRIAALAEIRKKHWTGELAERERARALAAWEDALRANAKERVSEYNLSPEAAQREAIAHDAAIQAHQDRQFVLAYQAKQAREAIHPWELREAKRLAKRIERYEAKETEKQLRALQRKPPKKSLSTWLNKKFAVREAERLDIKLADHARKLQKALNKL